MSWPGSTFSITVSTAGNDVAPPAVPKRLAAIPALAPRQVLDASRNVSSELLRVLTPGPVHTTSEAWLLSGFRPISLEDLNSSSAMLERLDNKYVVHKSVLQHAVEFLTEHFDILDIEGKRAFGYETCYFDDAQRTCYFEHHQGRRQRCKIRVRNYTDTRSCFIEVKLKDTRGRTIKKRLEYPVDKFRALDERALAYIRSSYDGLYRREFRLALRPVLDINYRRVSLAAKDGGERMTIDTGLVFFADGRSFTINDSLFIVETKSTNGNGLADKILRRLHQHPTGNCSKYCIGTALLQMVDKYNKFLPALRKLDVAQGARRAVKSSGDLSDDSVRPCGSPAFA